MPRVGPQSNLCVEIIETHGKHRVVFSIYEIQAN